MPPYSYKGVQYNLITPVWEPLRNNRWLIDIPNENCPSFLFKSININWKNKILDIQFYETIEHDCRKFLNRVNNKIIKQLKFIFLDINTNTEKSSHIFRSLKVEFCQDYFDYSLSDSHLTDVSFSYKSFTTKQDVKKLKKFSKNIDSKFVTK